MINGFYERDEDCEACKLMKIPSKSFYEINLCQREMGSYYTGNETTIDEVEYFILMSDSLSKVEC